MNVTTAACWRFASETLAARCSTREAIGVHFVSARTNGDSAIRHLNAAQALEQHLSGRRRRR
jgi:hypothetical protein